MAKRRKKRRKLRTGRLLILAFAAVVVLLLGLKVCGSRSENSDAAAAMEAEEMEGAETVFDEEGNEGEADEGEAVDTDSSEGVTAAASSAAETTTGANGETVAVETTAAQSAADADYSALDPVVLVYASSGDEDSISDLWARAFAQKIEEITDGKMTVDYYGQLELGNDQDIIFQMQAGTVDCTNMQSVNVETYVSALSALELPYVFSGYNAETIDNVLKPGNDFWTILYSEFEDSGFELIDCLQDATYCQLTCTEAVNTRAGFRKITIGTFSTYQRSFWGNLGCGAKSMDADELYDAVKNGLVTAGETSLDTQVSTKLYEVQPYVIMTNRLLYCYPFFITSTRWNTLDTLYQNAISEASLATSAELQPQMQQINDDAKQTLIDNGVQFIELDNDTITSMIEANEATTVRIRAIAGDEICNQLINGLAGRDVIAEQESIAAAEKEKAKEEKKKSK